MKPPCLIASVVAQPGEPTMPVVLPKPAFARPLFAAPALALALLAAAPACAQMLGSAGVAAPVATGTPAPMTVSSGNGAAADYPIGAGDLLSIAVYRSPDLGGLVRTQ